MADSETGAKPDIGYCDFLHCDPKKEDWARCPDPNSAVRQFERYIDGVTDRAWYCDEGAKEAMEDGIFLRLISEHP